MHRLRVVQDRATASAAQLLPGLASWTLEHNYGYHGASRDDAPELGNPMGSEVTPDRAILAECPDGLASPARRLVIEASGPV
jgi:hypothetical protein